MKLQALNDFVIVAKIGEEKNQFVVPESLEKIVNDTRKVKVVSVPENMKNIIAENDVLYIQSGSLMQLEDFFFIKSHSIIGKEIL